MRTVLLFCALCCGTFFLRGQGNTCGNAETELVLPITTPAFTKAGWLIGQDSSSYSMFAPPATTGWCYDAFVEKDHFYKFVATSDFTSIYFATEIPLNVEIFGGTCSSPVTLRCTTGQVASTEGFTVPTTPGETYRMRVTTSAGGVSSGQYRFNIREVASPGATCATAGQMLLAAQDRPCAFQQYLTNNSSQVVVDAFGKFTADQPAAGADFCNDGAKEHFWKFTATEPFFRLGFSEQAGFVSPQLLKLEIFTGDCSGSQTQIYCSESVLSQDFTDRFQVTPGNTVYLRITADADAAANGADYGLCIREIRPAVFGAPVCIDGFNYEVNVFAHQITGSGTSYNIIDDKGNTIASNITTDGQFTSPIYSSLEAVSFSLIETTTNQIVDSHAEVQEVCFPVESDELPRNDECSGAFELPLGDGTCGPQRTAAMFQATNSGVTVTNPCDQFYTSTTTDSWFTVTNTFATARDITVFMINDNNDHRIAIFSGDDCGSLTMLPNECSTGQQDLTVENVAPGTTLYVLLMTNLNIIGNDASFRRPLCATASNPTAPPPNDEIANAFSAPAVAGNTCTNIISGTTKGATDSNIPTSDPHDVWYTTPVPASGDLTLEITSGSDNMSVSVYSGDPTVAANYVGTYEGPTVQLIDLPAGTITYSVFPQAAFNPDVNFLLCVSAPDLLATEDDCAATVAELTLQASTNCTPERLTTAGTTQSQVTCASFPSGNSIKDAWFRFVAVDGQMNLTFSNTKRVNSSLNTGVITYVQVFSGACGSLTNVECASVIDGNAVEMFFLTPGDTYYARVWDETGTELTTDVCLTAGQDPPANFRCTDAETITLPAGNDPDDQTAWADGTTAYAFDLGGQEGVWYELTATGARHSVMAFNVEPATTTGTRPVSDVAMEYYSGSCGNLTALGTSDFGRLSMTGLTNGETYYIRVFEDGANDEFIDFRLVALTPTSRTDCATPTTLPANADNTCTNTVTGDLRPAHSTTGLSSCFTNTPTAVHYFQFDPTGPSETLELTIASQTTTVAAYTGTCGNLTEIACDFTSVELTGLSFGNPSDRITVAIFADPNGTAPAGTYEICRRTPLPPPANDEPAGAVTLTYSDLCTTAVEGTIEAATQTMAPDCADPNFSGQDANDVWYQFTAPSNSVNINVVPKNFASFAVELFAGTNLNGSAIACAVDGMGFGETTLTATVTQGLTYYVRVYDAQDFGFGGLTGDDAKFSICLSGLPTVQLPFANGQCENADATIDFLGTTNTWKYFTDADGRLVAGILDSENLGTVTGSFYADFNNTPRQNGTGVEVMNRNFGLNAQKQPTNPVNVRLFVSENDYQVFIQNQDGDGNDADDLTDLVVYRFTGQNCLTMPPMGGTLHTPIASGQISNTGYYVEIQIPSFSAFFLSGNGAVLPVVWQDFTAQRTAPRRVDLRWTTASEWNSDRFIVERSADDIDWRDVGVLPAAGITQTETHYDYTDRDAPKEDLYYRLRQTDYDGQYHYSEVRFVAGTEERIPVEIIPNPTHDFVTVKNLLPGARLRVFNGYGHLVQTVPATDVDQNVYLLDRFPAGVYLLEISEPGRRTRTERVLKVY